MELKFCVPEESERRFLYTVDEQQIAEACVGYLRMDFDSSGMGFHTTWFGKNALLNDRRFGHSAPLFLMVSKKKK